ncbi:MAG: hypothetical protein ACXVBJ_08435, partial [Flavisolibacter sp.]
MLKRNKGYFLLTMLVLTGLAGRMHTNILTTKERHALVVQLKTSRTDFLKTIEGLTPKQLNFKTDKNSLSIKGCVYKLVSIQHDIWLISEQALHQETQGLRRTGSDENLVSILEQKDLQCSNSNFKNISEALKVYKTDRAAMLKYVNTSTENVRSHVAQTSAGNFDAYQLMLINVIYCN